MDIGFGRQQKSKLRAVFYVEILLDFSVGAFVIGTASQHNPIKL